MLARQRAGIVPRAEAGAAVMKVDVQYICSTGLGWCSTQGRAELPVHSRSICSSPWGCIGLCGHRVIPVLL